MQLGKLTKYQAASVYQRRPKSLGIASYIFLDRLGTGGSGSVYKAKHRKTGDIVAVKVLNLHGSRSADALKRFQREAETAARLQHPNLVRALETGESGGQYFTVMELVEGIDLSTYVKKQGPLPFEQATHCILETARALAYAHDQGVIHRDIKPANLMLSAGGKIKVLDMGLARLQDPGAEGNDQAAEGLTQTGQVMGTVDYMAPEQALHTRHADARADVYSLGCTFYRLVTGDIPFDGDSMVAKILAHREKPIPSIRSSASQGAAGRRRRVAANAGEEARRSLPVDEGTGRRSGSLPRRARDYSVEAADSAGRRGARRRLAIEHVHAWRPPVMQECLMRARARSIRNRRAARACPCGRTPFAPSRCSAPSAAASLGKRITTPPSRRTDPPIEDVAVIPPIVKPVPTATAAPTPTASPTSTANRFAANLTSGNSSASVNSALTNATTGATAASGDYTLASWCFDRGFRVVVHNGATDEVREVSATPDLPKGPLTIMAVIAASAAPVNADDFDKLAAATELSAVSLQRAMVSDASLAKLTAFPKLQTVVLNHAPISDASLAVMRQLGGLKHLELAGTQVTEQALDQIAQMSGLVTLNLAELPVTDAGLAKLAGLEQLKVLNLGRTRLTDAALGDAHAIQSPRKADDSRHANLGGRPANTGHPIAAMPVRSAVGLDADVGQAGPAHDDAGDDDRERRDHDEQRDQSYEHDQHDGRAAANAPCGIVGACERQLHRLRTGLRRVVRAAGLGRRCSRLCRRPPRHFDSHRSVARPDSDRPVCRDAAIFLKQFADLQRLADQSVGRTIHTRHNVLG